MKLIDSFELVAPRAEVWEFFLDIDRLARCMPGVESVEEVDDTHYKGALVVQLGPVKAKFVGDVTITKKVEPGRMTGSFVAKDRGAGSNVRADFVFTLDDTEATLTTAHYDVDLVIRGKMATFGGSVIAETARQMTAVFAASVQAELNAAHPKATGEAATGGGPAVAASDRLVAPAMPKVSPVGIVLKSIWAVIKETVSRLVSRLFHHKGSRQHR